MMALPHDDGETYLKHACLAIASLTFLKQNHFLQLQVFRCTLKIMLLQCKPIALCSTGQFSC